ncbi:hypothetical protein HMPREF1545_02594 [Oscillibacter sp. KLE 1728]|nr:hypothetical protein HMPREF1545_02594 [Oscillibacter sp. KLE 1728]ERK59660.1 hypothetical protein HMPREF1546_03248 [Oscillibacter sp. KLE 1745]
MKVYAFAFVFVIILYKTPKHSQDGMTAQKDEPILLTALQILN